MLNEDTVREAWLKLKEAAALLEEAIEAVPPGSADFPDAAGLMTAHIEVLVAISDVEEVCCVDA